MNHMDDPRDPVRAGMRGTVRFVDDQSQIHIQWDNGRGLALIPGVDSFRKLTQEELVQECVPLQKGIFCIVEEDGCFEGYTTGKTWNGWVQPLFEKDTAEKVCAKYLGGQQAKTVYDRERNSFVVDDHELGMAYEYEGKPYQIDGEIKILYPIGSGEWCWDYAEGQDMARDAEENPAMEEENGPELGM